MEILTYSILTHESQEDPAEQKQRREHRLKATVHDPHLVHSTGMCHHKVTLAASQHVLKKWNNNYLVST